jgi:hypothetical protein
VRSRQVRTGIARDRLRQELFLTRLGIYCALTSFDRKGISNMKKLPCLALFLGAIALAACGGGESKPAPASNAASSAPAANAPAAAGDIGVAECDDYIKKYDACIDGKVPESARATVRQALDQTKAAWRQAAATPQGKAGLAAGCKTALDTAKTAMGAYGCTW